MVRERLLVHTRRGAYVALVALTLIWGFNWIALKFALARADPVILNVHRTWIAVIVLFAILLWQRHPFWPTSWVAVIVTGFFQTSVNFGATTLALAGGGVGRTSVLVFTMPFWTLVLAWPVLHERVRAANGSPSASRWRGSRSSSSPGTGAAISRPSCGRCCRDSDGRREPSRPSTSSAGARFDPLNLIAWQMLAGVIPITAAAVPARHCRRRNGARRMRCCCSTSARSRPASASCCGSRPAFPAGGHGVAQHVRDSGDCAVSSMLVFGERLTPTRMARHREHRRGPRDHLDERASRTPRRGVRHRAARRRLATHYEALGPSPICDCSQLGSPSLPMSSSCVSR